MSTNRSNRKQERLIRGVSYCRRTPGIESLVKPYGVLDFSVAGCNNQKTILTDDGFAHGLNNRCRSGVLAHKSDPAAEVILAFLWNVENIPPKN